MSVEGLGRESDLFLSDDEDSFLRLFEGIHRLEGISDYAGFLELHQVIMNSQISNPYLLTEFEDRKKSLSKDATYVISLVHDVPTRLYRKIRKKKRGLQLTMNDLRGFLVRRGWSYNRVNKSFAEVVDFIKK